MAKDAREELTNLPVATPEVLKDHPGIQPLDLDAMVDQLEVRDSRGHVQSVVEWATPSGDLTEFQVTDYMSKMDKTYSVLRIDESRWAIVGITRDADSGDW